MQLPQFIARMLGFAEKVEADLAATKELETVKARIQALEAEVLTCKKAATDAIAERDALNVKLTDLQGKLTARNGEIATLTAQVAAEKKRANDTLASQGISTEQLPAAGASETPGAQQETAWTKYQRLLASNPREAGAFWAEKSKEIIESRSPHKR
jgi:TolA-binding protein